MEFLVDEDTRNFYFLEVNTRLQVGSSSYLQLSHVLSLLLSARCQQRRATCALSNCCKTP